jgi:hypothetical protein
MIITSLQCKLHLCSKLVMAFTIYIFNLENFYLSPHPHTLHVTRNEASWRCLLDRAVASCSRKSHSDSRRSIGYKHARGFPILSHQQCYQQYSPAIPFEFALWWILRRSISLVTKHICRWCLRYTLITVIPRLTKIIRSGITFVSRNLRYSERDFP